MPDQTRRERIIEAMTTRLEAITQAGGFNTDAGASLFVNELPQFGPDDPSTCLSLVTQEDDVTWQGKGFLVRLPLTVLVLIDAQADSDSWTKVEQVIADVKRAVELEDRTLGGLLVGYLERGTVEPIVREPGSTVMGASVTYLADFKEGWGAP